MNARLSSSFHRIITHSARRYTTESAPLNQKILELLQQCKEDAKRDNASPYILRTWSNAIKVVSNLTEPIKPGDDTGKISGLGSAPRKTINSFFYGQVDSSGEHLNPVVQQEAIRTLTLVPGIGSRKAKILVEAGCLTIADLKKEKYFSLLAPGQKISVKYSNSIEEETTREEAELIEDFCAKHLPPEFEFILVGPYRRGAQTFNPIHLMMLHKKHVYVPTPDIPHPGAPIIKGVRSRRGSTKFNAWSDSGLLHADLLPALQKLGLTAETLSENNDMWKGIVRLPMDEKEVRRNNTRREAVQNQEGVYRQLVINLVPQKSRGAALLTLTGDPEFIREARMKASRLGMYLNEYGLWRWRSSSTSDENPHPQKGFWSLSKVTTEEGILEELDMEYVPPTKRNFKFILKSSGAKQSPRERRKLEV